MAESQTIARPYADAAFSLAVEQGGLPAWSDALTRLAAVMRTPEAQAIVADPRLPVDRLVDLIADAAQELSAEQRNFVRILADNDRLPVLPEIAVQFENKRNRHDDVLDVKVVSAYPVTDGQLADVIATLQQRFGRKVKAQPEVDPELIGGVMIRIGDEVIDASVRGKLAQLAAILKN
jgi:F-type H+-transporting ATPase subunit delta